MITQFNKAGLIAMIAILQEIERLQGVEQENKRLRMILKKNGIRRVAV